MVFVKGETNFITLSESSLLNKLKISLVFSVSLSKIVIESYRNKLINLTTVKTALSEFLL